MLEPRAEVNGVSSKFVLSFIKELSSTYIWHQTPEPRLNAVELISAFSVPFDSFSQFKLYDFSPKRFMGMTLDILDYERYRRTKTKSMQVISLLVSSMKKKIGVKIELRFFPFPKGEIWAT